METDSAFAAAHDDIAAGRPITPLHGGHVGLLCTAGLLNGAFGEGDERCIAPLVLLLRYLRDETWAALASFLGLPRLGWPCPTCGGTQEAGRGNRRDRLPARSCLSDHGGDAGVDRRWVALAGHRVPHRWTGMASAQITRRRVAAGHRGGTRSVTQTRGNGQLSGTLQAVGPNGASYTNQRDVSAGQYSDTRIATGPNGTTRTTQRTAQNGELTSTKTVTGCSGATYTNQRTAGNGQYIDTRMATGPNGGTYTSQRLAEPGQLSSTKTAMGPNGGVLYRSAYCLERTGNEFENCHASATTLNKGL